MHYEFKQGAPIYEPKEKESADEKDSYYLVRRQATQVFQQNMFFPRMWDEGHADMYESWMGGIQGRSVDGVKMPTQWENIKFFLSYQCNFMYWRYFMWNFAGRQNDIQGHNERRAWQLAYGLQLVRQQRPRSGRPEISCPTRSRKIRATMSSTVCLCCLVFSGLFWQAFRGKRGIQQFWTVFFLFFMTGLAIVIYLNQTPGQPRERDYAYARFLLCLCYLVWYWV